MQPFETIYVDGPMVACDGNGGVGGHPRVYLNLARTGSVECPYCSRLFVKRDGAGHGVESPSALGPEAAPPSAHEPPAAPAKP
jgi:uncharacterized Zn-finger protein